MLGLRQKLSLGFGGLLLIILIIGIQSIIHLTQLGQSIDVILRENYRSVIACQEMKEALERMDSGILFIFLGEKEKGTELIQKNEAAFEKALQVELNNITLPGEGEKAHHLQDLFKQYQATLHEMQGIENFRRPTAGRLFQQAFSLVPANQRDGGRDPPDEPEEYERCQ